MAYDLVCLGNPLLDLQVNVEPEYLNKYGLKEDDAILVEENQMSIYNEVLQKDDLILVAGGAAQNTARGAQYILPENSVVYFGCVGEDVYKEKLLEANAKYGLATRYQTVTSEGTGKCAALIYKQHRSLVTHLAAANCFKPEHFDIPENWEIVTNASVYYIGGYHLTVSPEAIIKLGKHASENKKPLALNLSAPFIPAVFKDALESVIPYADIIIGNETEAASYASANGLSGEDALTVAKHIAALPKVNTATDRVVIFTQGTEPSIVVTHKNGEYQVTEHPVQKLSQDQLVDTNGAGDAFAAGFIASVVQKKSIDEAVAVGQWAAKLSIQQVGPTFPFPKQTYSA